MSDIKPILNAADANLETSLEKLFDLVRIPSISTDPKYNDDCQKTAVYLSDYLNELGFDASVRQTTGHPMVVGHHEGAIENAPHVLFYGHYDVQPVDPLELWDYAPFEPQIMERNGRKVIAGRGTSDDKGQLMTFVEACHAYKQINGSLPCKITILFEGEEESGSPSLQPFLEANKDELKADFALVCDTSMFDPQTPAIPTSLRGLLGEEVTIHAASRDLHSGLYGGAAANPITILSRIIADLHDDEGRITIDGFYEGVHETPDHIKDMWKAVGKTDQEFLGEVGLSENFGETGRSAQELTWARPTAEINGIIGGYTDAGFKTVIPAIASAKISFRLVGDQDADALRISFRKFVTDRLPKDCTASFHEHGASGGIQLSFDSPLIQKATKALSDEWPKPTVLVGMGGSIPIVGDFQTFLSMDSLLVGFGLADDQLHSPNEKYELTSFHKGIRSWIRILNELATE
jgi:acetylornithine deacetylase/succinyl-diaminopimelate desuccinylase-like protein